MLRNIERLSGFDSVDAAGTKFTTDLICEELSDNSHVYNLEFTIKPADQEKPVSYELQFSSYTDAYKAMEGLSTSL